MLQTAPARASGVAPAISMNATAETTADEALRACFFPPLANSEATTQVPRLLLHTLQ
ncbi:hypothetical protein [Lysobacter sp. ESA13C]|uniref:hypothetical protein n=1 Tax=Lysobacter sp. ESA13C TaxID=2862676 RepID=UPI0021073CB1|nr:hypothetical protein [Lysobacter sp. ESA13C]